MSRRSLYDRVIARLGLQRVSSAALAAPDRLVLPKRRPQVMCPLSLDGTTFFVGIGIGAGPDGVWRPYEIFINGGKEGTALQLLTNHIAIVLSVALQHGVPIDALSKSLVRPSADEHLGWPADLMPAVLETIAAEMRSLNACDTLVSTAGAGGEGASYADAGRSAGDS